MLLAADKTIEWGLIWKQGEDWGFFHLESQGSWWQGQMEPWSLFGDKASLYTGRASKNMRFGQYDGQEIGN